ncbi:MAG: twin-arginine translocase TatA/TatE family subunit [Nitrospira sp.]|nr:twin-arginine translocase TatA/TatE family subunit [Nitrospira sp.]
MFGTMGFSELIIILVIVLIIFGAGRLPQIGEGVGKALKGFRKEVNDVPQSVSGQLQQESEQPQAIQTSTNIAATVPPPTTGSSPATTRPQAPHVPGPELTPGTTASLLYNTSLQTPQTRAPSSNQASASASDPVLSMEERAAAPPPRAHASYPPLPAGSQTKATAKRPSAIVNKDAVARVQAQQAALKAKSPQSAAVSPDDLQNLGEGLGEVVRTFRQAVTDVRHNVDPQMSTIQAEMDAAKKEIQQSIEAAKEPPPMQEDS